MKPSTIVTSCRNALRWQSVALLVAMSATAAFASDAIEPVIRPVTTSHTAVIDGTTVAYQAMFAETPLGKDPDHPGATMSATTYLRTGVADAASRPVVFLFNGGPGASSTPLHLHALGPRRIILGGQSYGGRQATMLAAEQPDLAAALLLFSYPLHPPGKPERLRVAHFPRLHVPCVFVAGTVDPFAAPGELRDAITAIPAFTEVVTVEGAGHDLKRGRFDLAPVVAAVSRGQAAASS